MRVFYVSLLFLLPVTPTSSAQERIEVSRIPAGVVPTQKDNSEWNRIVLMAQPKIASGDVSALSQSIRNTVASFVLTIMAKIEAYQKPGTGEKKYRLADVGVGFSHYVDDEWVVISSDSQARLGANLGFIAKQMLKTNESQLETARVVAKTSTLFLFDTPSLMYRDNRHVKLLTRHFIWIDSSTGKSSTLVWLIGEDQQGNWSVVNEPMRWVPAGTKEERRIHVDGDEFLLGIPSEQAFALEGLPPGKDVNWTPQAQQLASKKNLDTQTLKELTIALNDCLKTLR
ncbi:MAG: hypothetical protein AAF483_07250 [Planctomycetota bacterium]